MTKRPKLSKSELIPRNFLTRRIFADDYEPGPYVQGLQQVLTGIIPQRDGEVEMNFETVRKSISSITDLGMALLALAIVASLLVGPQNMSFLGDVVGNVTALVKSLGSAGLAGLISLGVVIWLIQNK